MATIEDLKEIFKGCEDWKVAIEINGFTGFRTTHLEELTQDEIDKIYDIYRPDVQVPTEIEFKEYIDMKKWRSYILTIAEKEGIKEPNSWDKFNAWMLNYSRFKKPLNELNLTGLKAVHKQLVSLSTNNEKSAQKPLTKAWQRKSSRDKDLN